MKVVLTCAALVAAAKGPTCPLSFLTFGNYSATGNVVAMSRVPYLPSLQKIANADHIEGNIRSPYHDDFVLARIEQALQMRIARPRLLVIEHERDHAGPAPERHVDDAVVVANHPGS